jgi:uncharacterized membrane protein YdjX (TVP38/TMEM64 family)
MTSTRLRTFARAGLVAAMLAAPLVITQVPTVRAAVFSLAATMRTGSLAGVALYVSVCVVGSLLTVPLWMLSGLAGFAYGFARGLATALPAVTLGGTTAFFIGRALARTAVGEALRDHPRFRMMESVVRHDGRRIAALLRVTPMMPQNLLHYALGATPLPARDFALATFVGLLPVTCFQVYAGSLAHDAAGLFEQGGASARDPATWAKAVGGLAVTAVLLALIVRRARRALAEAVAVVARSGEAP